jgi:hypothetical protein
MLNKIFSEVEHKQNEINRIWYHMNKFKLQTENTEWKYP